MQKNFICQARAPRNQKNWERWEEQVIRHASGSFDCRQVANILTFLGSKRCANSVSKKAGSLGWSLKVTKL